MKEIFHFTLLCFFLSGIPTGYFHAWLCKYFTLPIYESFMLYTTIPLVYFLHSMKQNWDEWDTTTKETLFDRIFWNFMLAIVYSITIAIHLYGYWLFLDLFFNKFL